MHDWTQAIDFLSCVLYKAGGFWFSVLWRNTKGRVQTWNFGHEAIGIPHFLLSFNCTITWVAVSFYKWRVYVISFSSISRSEGFSLEKLLHLLYDSFNLFFFFFCNISLKKSRNVFWELVTQSMLFLSITVANNSIRVQ